MWPAIRSRSRSTGAGNWKMRGRLRRLRASGSSICLRSKTTLLAFRVPTEKDAKENYELSTHLTCHSTSSTYILKVPPMKAKSNVVVMTPDGAGGLLQVEDRRFENI